MRIHLAITVGAFLLPGLSYSAVPTGPAVGAAVPTFQAPDQNGVPHDLHSLMGPKGAILVFYRSADW
ncbi:MAG: peroxiredoxin family protein [Acidobacteriota bacterium]|nr:peroxiredoxin family protein [Acidobacteriota bacterium]